MTYNDMYLLLSLNKTPGRSYFGMMLQDKSFFMMLLQEYIFI